MLPIGAGGARYPLRVAEDDIEASVQCAIEGCACIIGGQLLVRVVVQRLAVDVLVRRCAALDLVALQVRAQAPCAPLE